MITPIVFLLDTTMAQQNLQQPPGQRSPDYSSILAGVEASSDRIREVHDALNGYEDGDLLLAMADAISAKNAQTETSLIVLDSDDHATTELPCHDERKWTEPLSEDFTEFVPPSESQKLESEERKAEHHLAPAVEDEQISESDADISEPVLLPEEEQQNKDSEIEFETGELSAHEIAPPGDVIGVDESSIEIPARAQSTRPNRQRVSRKSELPRKESSPAGTQHRNVASRFPARRLRWVAVAALAGTMMIASLGIYVRSSADGIGEELSITPASAGREHLNHGETLDLPTDAQANIQEQPEIQPAEHIDPFAQPEPEHNQPSEIPIPEIASAPAIVDASPETLQADVIAPKELNVQPPQIEQPRQRSGVANVVAGLSPEELSQVVKLLEAARDHDAARVQKIIDSCAVRIQASASYLIGVSQLGAKLDEAGNRFLQDANSTAETRVLSLLAVARLELLKRETPSSLNHLHDAVQLVLHRPDELAESDWITLAVMLEYLTGPAKNAHAGEVALELMSKLNGLLEEPSARKWRAARERFTVRLAEVDEAIGKLRDKDIAAHEAKVKKRKAEIDAEHADILQERADLLKKQKEAEDSLKADLARLDREIARTQNAMLKLANTMAALDIERQRNEKRRNEARFRLSNSERLESIAATQHELTALQQAQTNLAKITLEAEATIKLNKDLRARSGALVQQQQQLRAEHEKLKQANERVFSRLDKSVLRLNAEANSLDRPYRSESPAVRAAKNRRRLFRTFDLFEIDAEIEQLLEMARI